MDFIAWHYTKGVGFYLSRYAFSVSFISHFFSLPLLITSLFAPWRRLVITEKEPGFNFSKWFSRFSYNMVSRLMGATVRLILFFVGILFVLLALVFGVIGLVVWFLLPPLSLPLYKKVSASPEKLAKKIAVKLNAYSGDKIKTVFDNKAGRFLIEHTGVTMEELVAEGDSGKVAVGDNANTYTDIISGLIERGVWQEGFFQKRGLTAEDFIRASNWWDRLTLESTRVEDTPTLGRPGVGLSLLYGYTPTLDKYSTDLSVTNFSHHLIGREQVVSRIERALSSRRSVIVTGKPGVGKKTVVLEFAHKAATGAFGEKQTYWRVVELDLSQVKKDQLADILTEAGGAGNVILVVRELHRYTNREAEGFDFTDVFEKVLEKGNLQVIAISTNTEYERFISQNMKLRKYFDSIEVPETTKEQAMEILIDAAGELEKARGVTIQVQALDEILEGSDQYITETPFPEKALELADAVLTYTISNGETMVTVNNVKSVLSEKTGVPMARLTESEKSRLANLEDIIHQRLVDQETAVSLIAKTLRSKQAGVTKRGRPIGSFLFLGPTGVGKTETAKVLSRVYYGSEDLILRFDMAEYTGASGVERLIGSIATNAPGALTTAIKNKPASLLLLDEIEKAPPEVRNLFLRLLDEGVITDAQGRKILCQHLFVVATSNAGAEFIRSLVEKGESGEALQKSVVNHVMEAGHFSPEFINRFDGVIVYEPLGKEELTKIATLMLSELSGNMKKQNIELSFDQSAINKLAIEGYDPAFGARPMRRTIDIVLGDTIGKAVLTGAISPGDKVKISGGNEVNEYVLQKLA